LVVVVPMATASKAVQEILASRMVSLMVTFYDVLKCLPLRFQKVKVSPDATIR